MPQPIKPLMLAMLVFLAPIATVVTMRWEALAEFVSVEPQSVEGTLIYFTSYG